MKAIVLETRNGAAAALREDGVVIRARQNCAVGDTIDLSAEILQFPGRKTAKKKKPSRRALRAAVAAAAALVILGSGGYTFTVAAAASYVSIDVGKASVELTLNRLGRVISVKALNNGGAELAGALSAEARNRPAGEAMELAVTHLREDGYLADGENSAVVAGVTDGNETRGALLAETVERSMERGGVPGVTVETTPQERREAAEREIGAGRYAMEHRAQPEETQPPRYLVADAPAVEAPETPAPPGAYSFPTPAPLETPTAGDFSTPGPIETPDGSGDGMTPPPELPAQGPDGDDITPPPAK